MLILSLNQIQTKSVLNLNNKLEGYNIRVTGEREIFYSTLHLLCCLYVQESYNVRDNKENNYELTKKQIKKQG